MTTDFPGVGAIPTSVTGTGTILGHPKGLAVLFSTEMWERFNYYGMRALLVLYMVKYLFLPGHLEHVMGYVALKGVLESMFGPLEVQPLASQIYGFYTGFVYMTPFFGGMIADRVLGQRRSVYVGGILMAAGEFMLTRDALFFPGLFAIILGNGLFKPNISTQVGGLYPPGDPRRDRAYSIFYVGVNLGAFMAPLIAGTLGENVGWHFGFAAAGIGMLIGLVFYALGQRHLPPDELTKAKAARRDHKPLNREEWKAILALLTITILVSFFWATYEQAGNTMSLWADENTDRTLGLGISWEIPVTWFQSVNPIMIFAFTPAIIWLWAWQTRKGTEPSTVNKMALGCLLVAVSNVIMAGAVIVSGGEKASWLWLILYNVTLTLGELYLSPVGLSLVSKVAPARVVSAMMGIWFIANFLGNLLSGYLGSFWSRMDKLDFFLMIAGIALLASVAIAAFNRPLKPILKQ
ncbi:MAG: transporter [Rhodospirillales bacterium]|nr:transporter [Rhodospirillales bacterium]